MKRTTPISMKLALLLVTAVGVALAQTEQNTFLGNIFQPPSSLPQPLAFFPLTEGFGNSIGTYPASQYSGQSSITSSWEADDTFGHVLSCWRETEDTAVLDSVQYAESGNFTIAFWFKANTSDLSGTTFEYMYSHTDYGLTNQNTIFQNNSINVYLPEDGHPATGLVRGAVSDSDDPDETSFLDSDGTYNNNNVRTSTNFKKVNDGLWHFVAISNNLYDQHGWVMYVDGVLAAELPPPGYTPGEPNIYVDGGQPIYLAGDIVLCSRDNRTADRFYSGTLSHLSLFSTTLSPEEVAILYSSVPLATGDSPTAAPPVTASPAVAIQAIASPSAATPAIAPAAAPTSAGLGYSAYINQFAGTPDLQALDGVNVQLCLLNDSAAASPCSFNLSYSCIPLSIDDMNNIEPSFQGLPLGVCARDDWVRLPIDSMPTPAAFYPLAGYSTASWPIPDTWFWNTSATGPTSWAMDPVFGIAVDCQASIESSLSIDNLTWGTSGNFAINVWIQQYENTGDLFQYVLSTRATNDGPINNPDVDIYDPNELHIYLPEMSHPADGLVRVILKDSTDNYTSPEDAVWLDSDGQVSNNDVRNTPRLNLTDGNWHMITVTTLPTGGQGFQIYVDGIFQAALEEPLVSWAISGGNPIFSPNIVLCGRSDSAPDRFFDGRIAQLAIFDNALTEETVVSLYNQVYISPPLASVIAGTAYNSTASQLYPPPSQQAAAPAILLPPPSIAAAPTQAAAPMQAAAPTQAAAPMQAAAPTQQAATEAAAPVASPASGPAAAPVSSPSSLPSATTSGTSTLDISKNALGVGSTATENGSGQGQPQQGAKLNAGAVVGIVVACTVGAVMLATVIVLLVLRSRRRRMNGVARLQEVAFPDHSPPESHYIENQFVVGVNAKAQMLGSEVLKSADLK